MTSYRMSHFYEKLSSPPKTAETSTSFASSLLHEHEQHGERNDLPPRSPHSPQPLRRSLSSFLTSSVADAVCILISLGFLSAGFIVRAHNGMSVEEHPTLAHNLIQAALYGPTFFPILFAAVVGRSIKCIFVWRLIKGTSIGTLDLLAGGTSLASVITTQLTLRIAAILSPVLLILWALSPIGSQATLRVLALGTSDANVTVPLQYMSQNGTFLAVSSTAASTPDDYAYILTPVLGAAMLSPERVSKSPRDLWSNVKMPRIEFLEATKPPDTDGWLSIFGSDVQYASLIGTPIANISSDASSTYLTFESSYWNIDCPHIYNGTSAGIDVNSTQWKSTPGLSGHFYTNVTSSDRPQNSTSLAPRHFIYSSADFTENIGQNYESALCTVSTTYVEAQVACSLGVCAVSRIRRSALPHPVSSWTSLDEPAANGVDDGVWTSFATSFGYALGGSKGVASAIQGYLIDAGLPFAFDAPRKSLTTMDPAIYSFRLSQLLNSYWTIGVGWNAISLGLNVNTTSPSYDESRISGMAVTATTEAIVTHTTPVLICRQGWLVALCVASLAMLCASLVSPIMRLSDRRTELLAVTPSTLLRDHKYIRMPEAGSTLDFSHKARLMKDVRVQFGDVASDQEVGYLAIASHGVSRSDHLRGHRKLYR